MKQINFNSPVVFVMVGYPGAGKSFFARQFSARSNAAHLNEDKLRAHLFEVPSFSIEENQVIFSLMDYMMEDYLQNGMSVIVDGENLIRGRKKSIDAISKKFGAKIVYILVQTDARTAYLRSSNRDKRSIDSKYAKNVSNQEFKEAAARVKKPKYAEYIVISGKHVFSNQFSAVASKFIPEMNGSKRMSLGGPVDFNRRSIPRQ